MRIRRKLSEIQHTIFRSELGLLKLNVHKTDLPFTMAGILLFSFMLSFAAGSVFLLPQASNAVTGLGLAGQPTMSLNTSSGSVDMRITPTGSGALASGSHTVTAGTNVPTGYNLSLNTPTAPSLNTTAGTIGTPTALSNNTWGFAINGVSSSSSANTIINGFNTSYTVPTPSDTSKWADPSQNATIKNTTQAAENDATTVYYGAKADMNLAAGTYSTAVRYTATANLSTLSAPSITTILPISGTTAGGTPIQIVGTGFTVNDQSVTTSIAIDGAACLNVSISSNTPATGQDTIYCNTPVHPTATAVDVAVTTWHSTASITGGFTYIALAPTITAPTANQIFSAETTSTILMATTDIPGICYYGSATNPTTQMTTTGGTSHSVSITGLANQSTNIRYVRCQAALGHSFSQNQSVSFYVRAVTPAAPTLSPANGATVNTGATTITVQSSGATCTWGTVNGSYPNTSGTSRTTTTGTNTLYYSCVAGSGNTQSDARRGSWSYTGLTVAQTGDAIQTVTAANCPTTRTRVYDARDNHTYWVQKLADGKCWMLTNLAYGGGGINTYGDTKAISNNEIMINAKPYYMIPDGSNVTSGTTNPSTSTNGNGQYGYLYNWCAAMGAQTNSSACAKATTPAPNTNISICPAGWRLPTGGGSGSEFATLNNAVNSGSTNSDSGLRFTWLGMYSGNWNNGFVTQGSYSYYWSSTQSSTSNAFYFGFLSDKVSLFYPGSKMFGRAVRCVAV